MNSVYFLEHYGVKGMKWGVRKQRSKREQKAINKRANARANIRTLSDTDIKAYTDRLSAEKKLKGLIDEDLSPGKTMAKRILSDSGQKVARTAIAGAGLYATKVAIETGLGLGKGHGKPLKEVLKLKEAAKYIAKNPKK